MRRAPLLCALASSFIHLAAAAATFQYSLDTPIQCSNLTVNVVGGTPPYELILVPIGHVTPEIRTIVDLNFTDTTISFPLKFPGNSSFSVVMSDATGFGTGGTGRVQNVALADDDSCLSGPVLADFFFYTNPNDTFTQCAITNLSWDGPPKSQGDVSFLGLIPGGQSFELPIDQNKLYYEWTVSVRAGTQVQLFVGDKRGRGTGGSIGLYTVQSGGSGCINELSPSSTAGSPAGEVTGAPAVSRTSSSATSASSTSASSSGTASPTASPPHKTNVGAIAGGVVGGVVGLALIAALLFFFCCRRDKRHPSNHNVDLMAEDPSDSVPPSAAPMIGAGFYQPEPFVVPEPGSSRPSTDHGHRPSTSIDGGVAVSSNSGRPSRDRRTSAQSLGQTTQWSDPSSRRKNHPPTAMRATNFVQHEDAGAVVDPTPAPEGEVLELPPMYQDVRKPKGAGSTEPSSGGGGPVGSQA